MSYLLCLDDCGHEPDLTSPYPDSAINWIGDSTPDQLRIEDVLSALAKRDCRILHVGVGNSDLASRFLSLGGWIDGVTIGEREWQMAQAAAFVLSHRYYTCQVNKYSAELVQAFKHAPYDFIIDNNLASYACCVTHFHQMMDNYRNALAPGGAILTDRAGLAHAPGDPNWNLVDDIQAVADRFGLVLTRETEMVYALRK
jgi:hypothetical protein